MRRPFCSPPFLSCSLSLSLSLSRRVPLVVARSVWRVGGGEEREGIEGERAEGEVEGMRCLLLVLLVACAHGSSLAGEAHQSRDEVQSQRSALAGRSLPPGMGWLRALSGECRSCLKECLGTKATELQQASIRYQAPLSLVTWYLFRNRPFKMWPLEEVVANLFKVNPGVYGGAAAVGYMSCSSMCDQECPFPGRAYDADAPCMAGLEEIEPSDTTWLSRLYRSSGGRGSKGGLQDMIGTFFQM
eukprot:scaffold76165_cov38-Tisochrysis_lutea.AAC.6